MKAKGFGHEKKGFNKAGGGNRRILRSFVNHLRDSNLEHLREPVGILESQKLPAQAIKQIKDFRLWDVHIADQASEYVVRGVTTRLAFIKLGAKQGNEALAKEKSEGFLHLEAVCQCLEQYEKQRKKYRGLRDYFHQIVSAFEKLAGQLAAETSAEYFS